MIVYGDRRVWLTPDMALARLHEAFARGAPGAAPRGEHHDALVELLIEAGTFEQALADSLEHGAEKAPPACAVARLTDLAAAAVARSHDEAAPAPLAGGPEKAVWWCGWRRAVAGALEDLGRADLPLLMEAVLPEGYLFYALSPEAYLVRMRQALRDSALRAPGAGVMVVGVRSIGTSLAAMAAVACGGAGVAVQRLTVRPQGDPFSREVAPPAGVAAALRGAARRGACFVVVDEGPGLSGSSLAAVARYLMAHAGVGPERIAFLCANPWPGPAAPEWVVACWRAVARWTVDGEGAVGALQGALAADKGLAALTLASDLSGGAWRDGAGLPATLATSHPRFERRKYLYRDRRGGSVRAKFVGLGRVGRRKAEQARALAAAGFVPPVVGYRRGFLLTRHVAGAALSGTGTLSAVALVRMADYFGYLAAQAGPEEAGAASGDAFGRLEHLVRENTRAWFGATLDRELAAVGRYRGIVERSGRAGGDGKPQPHEWLAARPLLKCDAADHHLDHGVVWPMDPAYDLAGTAVEWGLSAAATAALLARYREVSGDWTVGERLPFYRIVYAAALLGQHDLSYHLLRQEGGAVAERGHHPASHDAARRRYAAALQGALGGAVHGVTRVAAGGAPGEDGPCAC